MLFDKKFSTSLLQLPENVRRRRSAYAGFYTYSLIQPVIDLHQEFPISALKKEPHDG